MHKCMHDVYELSFKIVQSYRVVSPLMAGLYILWKLIYTIACLQALVASTIMCPRQLMHFDNLITAVQLVSHRNMFVCAVWDMQVISMRSCTYL